MIQKYVCIVVLVLSALSLSAAVQNTDSLSVSFQSNDSLMLVIDSLKQTVTSLSGEIKENKEDTKLDKVWNTRKKYINIGYVNQSLTREENGGGTWRSEKGFSLSQGRTYYLHKKPVLGMVKFGIDWTIYDLNLAIYKDKFGVFGANANDLGYGDYYYEDGYRPLSSGEVTDPLDMSQIEIGTQIGPSITVNPVSFLKASLYFRVAPSYSMLTVNEEIYHSYGTFFTFGGSVAFKAISVGIEGRWGNTKYNNIDLGNLEDEDNWEDGTDISDMLRGKNDKIKWKTGSMRFYVSFRLGK